MTFLLMRRRFVAQLAVVTGEPELLDQSELRKQFRLAEDEFGESLLVKQIQAPRPEPNQIDEEDRDHEHRDRHDSKKPFQHALKHG